MCINHRVLDFFSLYKEGNKCPVKKLASCIICICLSFLQDKSLYHPVSNSCIDSSPSERRVFMNTCDPASLSQLWLFERTNTTVLEHFNQGTNWAYWTVRWHVFQKERSWLKGHLCSSESFWGKRCLILFWNGQITLLFNFSHCYCSGLKTREIIGSTF